MKPKTTMPAPSQTIYQTLESIELQEQIRRRAYELYEQRGREDGRDLDDWLQAESEVTQQKAMTVAA
jgi:outer membrane protein TolC